MNPNDPQRAHMQNYLQQQMQAALMELPPNASLEEFKAHVRTWMEIDGTIRKLQAAIRDRKQLKKQLAEKILDFMARYNIEDLNTAQGKLRYHVSHVKPSLSKKAIKEKLAEAYPKARSADELVKEVFDNSVRVERPTLRRVHVRNALDLRN